MEDMASIFAGCRTIAVVGMSNNPAMASHDVARYLMDFYQVIPVNPNFESLLGLTCYPDLQSIPVPVDMVDMFQRSENIPPFVQPAIDIGAIVFWMQLGISNAAAAATLRAAGLTVVQNKCTLVEHRQLANLYN